ncbi:hypothetical protein [Pseudarthrobacter raffinosi]|uniref:hypothetical protein n=1 Tax=Pseudarthrobacter raffinosi TaxID=2953651 RepID=UPI0035AB7818
MMSLISTASAWCGIIFWANMASASLKSAEAAADVAGAEVDGMAELPWLMPGMLLESELPVPAEHPARPIAAAIAAAEIVRVYFMKIRVLKGISGV